MSKQMIFVVVIPPYLKKVFTLLAGSSDEEQKEFIATKTHTGAEVFTLEEWQKKNTTDAR